MGSAELAETAIHVTAGVMLDKSGCVLVSRRPAGKIMAGAWEFPGGKLRPGEGRLDGLARELEEELGVQLDSARPLIRYRHRYPDLEVDLDAWLVTSWQGAPRGLEGQAIGWRAPEELFGIGLLLADEAIVLAIQLPDTVTLTPAEGWRAESLLDAMEGVRAGLICLRQPGLDVQAMLKLAAGAACRIEGTDMRLLLHGDPGVLAPVIMEPPRALRARLADAIAGLHVPARYLAGLAARPLPDVYCFGASCHNARELEAALAVGADYAFLGPVKPTASHPGSPGIGWEGFAALVADLPLPVYAIGGMGPGDLETAWDAGAQGIAGIRGFWPEPERTNPARPDP
jgi:8-oxo-dGTP diphosphatase